MSGLSQVGSEPIEEHVAEATADEDGDDRPQGAEDDVVLREPDLPDPVQPQRDEPGSDETDDVGDSVPMDLDGPEGEQDGVDLWIGDVCKHVGAHMSSSRSMRATVGGWVLNSAFMPVPSRISLSGL